MPQIRRSGPRQEAAPKHNTNTSDSSLYRRQDGYPAPTPEAREDAAFEAEAKARGYRLSLDCIDCGHPIVTEASLRRHRGPRCAARVGTELDNTGYRSYQETEAVGTDV